MVIDMEQESLRTDHLSVQEISMLSEEALQVLTEFFRTFGDLTRIRILNQLERGEICVNDLADTLSMKQSAVSHQLRILKQNRLVKSRREGKQILYSLDDEHVRFILEAGVEHVRELFPG